MYVLNIGPDTSLDSTVKSINLPLGGPGLLFIQFPCAMIGFSPPHSLAAPILRVCNQPLRTAVMCLVKAV